TSTLTPRYSGGTPQPGTAAGVLESDDTDVVTPASSEVTAARSTKIPRGSPVTDGAGQAQEARRRTMSITVYSKPACVQCDATYRALDKRGIEYSIVDISQDAEALEMVRGLGYL